MRRCFLYRVRDYKCRTNKRFVCITKHIHCGRIQKRGVSKRFLLESKDLAGYYLMVNATTSFGIMSRRQQSHPFQFKFRHQGLQWVYQRAAEAHHPVEVFHPEGLPGFGRQACQSLFCSFRTFIGLQIGCRRGVVGHLQTGK